MLIKTKDFIPNKLDHRDVFIKEDKNYLFISCNKIRPPKPLKLKKEVRIDEFFIETIGLYFGDGTNTTSGSGNRRVALANTNFILHNHWIKFLNKFGLSKNSLYAQIQKGHNINLPDSNIFNYWSNKTKIPLSNFSKTISIKNVNIVEYGLLVVNYHNKLFRKIFDNLFKFSLELCKNNKNFATAFIRGLFAAEGYVNLNKYKSLAWLDIPIKDIQRRIFVKNLFKDLGIKTKDVEYGLLILSYLNFRLANKFNLISMHPKKAKNFKNGFKHLIKYGSVPALTKLRIINSLKDNSKTRFQISKEISSGISAVHKSLRDLEIKKIVKREGMGLSINGRKLRQKWSLIKIPDDLSILMNADYCKRRA